MKDRVPTKPNRYAIYDDAHNFLRYEYHERADEPTQAGDPVNKDTFLSDSTAALYGLGSSALPDDILGAIKNLLDQKVVLTTGSYTGTGSYGSSNRNTLTFPFVPSLVVIQPNDGGRFDATTPAASYIWGNATMAVTVSNRAFGNIVTISGKTMSWYEDNVKYQLNESGIVYRYMAFK